MKILILGASGMLGHALFYELSRIHNLAVVGTVRDIHAVRQLFPHDLQTSLVGGVDAYAAHSIENVIRQHAPDVVINCIGLIRQRPESNKPLPCIEINARLPHLLHAICIKYGSRLIHYSTDCVFDGKKGSPYTEDDPPTAKDLYGLSKFLGELHDQPALTLRTSIIGHEITGRRSLVEWFLNAGQTVQGYTQAIFSGLPATEHARVLVEYILPNKHLTGLYHLAAHPISKHDLLSLIGHAYAKNTVIVANDAVQENKQLSAQRFAHATNYSSPPWGTLIEAMRQSHLHYMKETS